MGHYYDCRYCGFEVNAPCENMAQAKECDYYPKHKRSTAMKPERISEGPIPHYNVRAFQPISSAPKNKWVLVRGESGYQPCPVFICIAKRDEEYRPRSPWIDVQSTCLSDRGWEPHEWTDVPPDWLKEISLDAYDQLAKKLGVTREEAKKQALAMGFSVINK